METLWFVVEVIEDVSNGISLYVERANLQNDALRLVIEKLDKRGVAIAGIRLISGFDDEGIMRTVFPDVQPA